MDRRAALRVLTVILVTACAHLAWAGSDKDKKKDDDKADAPILTQKISPVPGPKRTIAVGAVDAIGPQASGSSGWNVGGSVAAMLTTALQESGRFIVVERAAISQVLTEQQLAAHGVSGGSSAPMPGKIIPAQYLIEGSVTEFGAADEGHGVSVGAGSGSFTGGLALSRTSGSVAFDLRIVNTRTAAIERTVKVRHELHTTGIGLTTGYRGLALGGNKFWSSPLGKATRESLNDAVEQIAVGIAGGQWQGAIVEVAGPTVYVNAGSAVGLKSGDSLVVQRASKVFTDPTTGEVLSQRQSILGTINLTKIEEKLSSGSYVPSDPSPPVRGDVVVLKKTAP